MSAPIKLVVIDDESDIAFIVRAAFARDPDVHVTTFDNGKDAIIALSTPSCHFDVALVDLKLPDISGLDVIRSLRKSNDRRNRRFVLFTASLVKAELMNGVTIDAVIEKPFDVLELRERVYALADRGSGKPTHAMQ